MTKEEQFVLYFNNMTVEQKADVLKVYYDPDDENCEIDIVISGVIEYIGPVIPPEPFYENNGLPLI